ncbi:hypothetical protein G4Y60_22655 [Salmonella enterica subsp. enterica]|uniref:hypothetical protein n=2 Tax=Salmonella enterica TaxID=28901 RepID=UPI0009AE7559|nr:hypothetical protein [Salmonella enterica]EAA6923674.1 hypothetical protein [Salmonella enterica subsp. enterica serovar Pomona]EBS0894797.1 hypothetical protein [Salmonella enterica subsp. enterica serovar Abaetetuba]EBW3178680.1 hypothetical protein [Salmonella enterica subsp. enterica serovar Javiana]EBW3901643.1 hypothetical protein [Salmonella enterica subsp. enterica serovar Panama]EBY2763213.1 hypothetical protein [Salmonella enterica subsp. enterica serovar Gaminara]EBY4402308.1 hy
MNDKEILQTEFLRSMNEKLKAELLDILPADHATTKAVRSSPTGCITTETMDLVIKSLTPSMLRRVKREITAWLDDELSYLDCQWDERYASTQKRRLFSILSGEGRN